jgi:hypothetical protein
MFHNGGTTLQEHWRRMFPAFKTGREGGSYSVENPLAHALDFLQVSEPF